MEYQFTPTQRKIMDVLSDGEMHSITQLHGCLPDELGSVENVQPHLTAIRKYIRTVGQDITSVKIDDTIYYRLVRKIGNRNYSE